MISSISKIILLSILISAFILPYGHFAFLQQEVNASPAEEEAVSVEELRKSLEEYEKKIAQYEANIAKTEKEKRTLKNQIAILRNRIGKLDAQVRQGNIAIRNLGIQIKETEFSIEETSLKIKDSREKLAAILRIIYEQDQRSILAVLLTGEEISDFFTNLVALETINLKNRNILGQIEALKLFLEGQKEVAIDEKEAIGNIVAVQLLQKQEGVKMRKEQERLHRMTEAEYQRYLREKAKAEKRTAEIRARIIQLVGIPDAAQLSFGELLDIAEVVQGQTGIRPAFLLAIITQESALGRNVGQCHIADKTSGASIHIRKGIRFPNGIAVPPRSKRNDLARFLKITSELGLDPLKTPISCPIVGIPGFGGAMGPAQFIPSTWANRRHILEPFVEGIPNPWNVNHAFLASALYLRDLGGQTNERRAALRYFAGGNWNNPRFRFYGDQVVKRINCLQTFIDHGTITSQCERMIFVPR